MLPWPTDAVVTKVVTVAEMQALEAASEAAGVSTDTLMENAGLACARSVRECMGGAAGRRVVVLVGPGNNGADGLVLARHLARWGADVCCYIVRGRPEHDPKMSDALAYGVAVTDSAPMTDCPTWAVCCAVATRSSTQSSGPAGTGHWMASSGKLPLWSTEFVRAGPIWP